MISKELQDLLKNDEENVTRLLRLFYLIGGVNKSIDASEKMKNSAMAKQLRIQKNKFVAELNEILEKQYQLLVME